MHQVNSLGDFIRAHRVATTPEQVGLAGGGFRRTSGLRREEVAALAGLSKGYYARLEQGREKQPSNQVLDALIRVFQLDAEAAEHMYRLARKTCRRQDRGRGIDFESQACPDMVRMIDGWKVPAIIIGPRLDILAENTLCRTLFPQVPPESNVAEFMFLDPAARELYLDWEEMAQPYVAALRASADLDPSGYIMSLVEELYSRSPEFRRFWASYDVTMKMRPYKRYFHPEVGEIELESHHFLVNHTPGQRLITWKAEPDSPSQVALDFLQAKAAEK
ncbi:helix-turn-helix transcriptional regulator [Actinacidiphila sp. bgisy160]|uniref:helix-turn-helix transcriptional regulator n=1 Tax=Actinacidiphila sp. bgisy160 TaxID=3413796 RepID=UPI003D71C7EF